MPFRLGDLVSVVASIGAVTLALVVIDQRSEIDSIRSKVEAIQMQMQSMAAASKRLESGADSKVAAVANGHLTPPVAFSKAGADGGAATVVSGQPVQPDAVMKAGMGSISPGFAESAPLNPPADAGVAVKSERPPQQAAFLQAIREAHLRNMQAKPPTPGVSASPFGQPPNEAKKNWTDDVGGLGNVGDVVRNDGANAAHLQALGKVNRHKPSKAPRTLDAMTEAVLS